MPEDSNEPRSEEEAAAALEEARRLARAFRGHMPEGEKRIFDEVLAKAGPFIRTLTSNPEIEPRDAFVLSVLVQALFMLGQVRDEIREMRGEGT
jgi:hypothetical protein